MFEGCIEQSSRASIMIESYTQGTENSSWLYVSLGQWNWSSYLSNRMGWTHFPAKPTNIKNSSTWKFIFNRGNPKFAVIKFYLLVVFHKDLYNYSLWFKQRSVFLSNSTSSYQADLLSQDPAHNIYSVLYCWSTCMKMQSLLTFTYLFCISTYRLNPL